MAKIYHIYIANGIIEYDCVTAPRKVDDYHAPNAKQWFSARGFEKPKPVALRGWPFRTMYITHGSEENGLALAWSK